MATGATSHFYKSRKWEEYMAHWKQFKNINLRTFIETVLVTNSLFKNGYEAKQKCKNILQFIKILAVYFIFKNSNI